MNDWLILMPANRFSNEITYNFPEGKRFSASYISVEFQNVMRQSNTPDETNGKQDYKAPPPGYNLLNLNASTTISIGGQPVTVSVGVRNALNTVYRDYLNSMRYFADEMGRNTSIRLKIPISSRH